MRLIEKIKDRYNILIIFVSIAMILLSFRLATLTIVEGDYYRDISDNKRLKEIYVTAPRGEIRDRYGRLLAGNKLSFTVQILKDEINTLSRSEKNEVLLMLARLLEEDGANYVDEFPINFNVFEYSSEEIYNAENLSPMDKVIDIIISNNLLPEILDTFYIYPDYEEHYKFITMNRAIDALEDKDIHVPIVVEVAGNSLNIKYDEKEDIELWKKEYGIDIDSTPKEAIVQLVNNNKNIIRKIMDHPIARQLAYNIIEKKNLNENIVLKDYSLSFDEEYYEIKRSLMNSFSNITLETDAKDDFVEIVTNTSLVDLLFKVVEETDDNEKVTRIMPGEILIDKIKEKGLESPVKIEYDEENSTVVYSYKNDEDRSGRLPIDALIGFAQQNNILKDFITDDRVKSIAQEVVLSNGYNPKISVSKWEYVPIVDKTNWYGKFSIPVEYDVEEAFNYLIDYYELDENLSRYELRVIMSLYDQLDKQGQRAYQPINIAYGIKDATVAKIEEGFVEYPGVQVSIEPVRYYPEKETAAHILGYLGKISQANEIEKYVVENNYSPNDIIGKTGIEEKYELLLKGKNGVKRVEVDVLGNRTNIIDEEEAIPGNNIYLTIDLELQKVAEKALEYGLEKIREGGVFESKWGDYKFGISNSKKRPYINATSGAVVVTSVKTGEILALANYPSYDPNLFATGISKSDWESLFPEHEEDLLAPRPLYNIAIQTAIQPGSTFKMVTALAALEKGLDPSKTIRDMGYVQFGTARFGCWYWNSYGRTHGNTNLYDAIRDSCNYYFYSLALGYNQRTGQPVGVTLGIEDIAEMAKKLGLNDKTGIEIDIPKEASGGVPNPQSKIMVTQALLRNYLKSHIRNYIKEGLEFTDKEIQEKINEIVSWLEEDNIISRNEVIRRLDEMGIEPEKVLPGDREGLADRIKYTYLNYAGWNITDTLNVTIGQGQNAYTPVQIANYIATIANGGYKNKLTLINSIKNYDNSQTIYEREVVSERIELNDYNNLEYVKLGMRKVVTEGSVRSIFKDFPISVAAKTGTAQRSGINPVTGDTYDEYAWFVAFAPYEDPEIAISIVLFQGGSGGYAAPIAREIIAQYFGLNNTSVDERLPFENGLGR
ncbi:MAG TPA: penicillin-binding protein [Tissierellia bacterium]|nr:penicillin-binding protein [Tissierellia bacterium]